VTSDVRRNERTGASAAGTPPGGSPRCELSAMSPTHSSEISRGGFGLASWGVAAGAALGDGQQHAKVALSAASFAVTRDGLLGTGAA
jgi:hypothetical protein